MSVLACSRRGCENIMCDDYSNNYGYICRSCLEELRNGKPFMDIDSFMDGEKSGDNMRDAWETFLKSEFREHV